MERAILASDWEPETLKRGRHKLPREAVRESQRQRLERATMELVAAHGYQDTSVREIVKRARVSFSAFSELYDDKADCFLAACDAAAGDLLRTIAAASTKPNWADVVDDAAQAYLQWWEAHPVVTRAYFIGLWEAGGSQTIEWRERNFFAFQEMYRGLAARAREEEPGLAPLDPMVPSALVYAIAELVAHQVRAGAPLMELRPTIVNLVLKLLR
jgi:AcrR family transcriptional regulator